MQVPDVRIGSAHAQSVLPPGSARSGIWCGHDCVDARLADNSNDFTHRALSVSAPRRKVHVLGNLHAQQPAVAAEPLQAAAC